MWGAIKNDLLSFVTTIQEDTTSTLNRVLGDGDDEVLPSSWQVFVSCYLLFQIKQEEEDITLQEKLVADLRRSYETYETVSWVSLTSFETELTTTPFTYSPYETMT